MENFDVIIVGAGVLGLSAGYWMSRQGARVLVLEKGRIGYEASSRAMGFQSLRGENPPEILLASVANKMWHSLDEELGYPTEWTAGGRLWVALHEEELADFARTALLWQSHDLPVRVINADEARAFVPTLTNRVVGGLFTERGGHANPQRTTQAFGWACQDRGAVIREMTPVTGIEIDRDRVTGVRTTNGFCGAKAVVICAGPQTSLLAKSVGVEVPLVSARLEACITAPVPRLFDTAMVANGLSVRQTKRGNILFCGGPHEWVNVDLTSEPAKPVSPILRGEARRLLELLPNLGSVPLLRTWAGIVEVSPDHACVLERARTPEGLVIASSSGHGIGLAPALGKIIGELALGETPSIPVAGLGLSRFADLTPGWAAEHRWIAGEYNT